MNVLAPPPGFVALHESNVLWWVKEGWAQLFPHSLKDLRIPSLPGTETLMTGGRGSIQRLALNDAGHAIIRRYRRGGFVRHFIHDVYWDRPFRPFAELICTETARERGAPTVEVLAAGVESLRCGFYRGVFISREAAGFVNLWEWLQTKPTSEERQPVIEAVAGAVAQLHVAGIFHADLNLTNILVRTSTPLPEVLTIDFDRAQVFPTVLPERYGKQVLRRFQRSLLKLDSQQRFTSPADREIFCRAYAKW
jgi:hypothetical protein